jgi:hypothetical protein
MNDNGKMTRSEIVLASQLLRKRERVMRSMVKEQGLKVLADLEAQLSAIYSYDQDEVWTQAEELAKKTVAEANQMIAAQSKALGIPKQFAPSIGQYWFSQGRNAVKENRDQMRKVVQKRVEAMEAEAHRKIEQQSLELQTQVSAHGLLSDAARTFLEQMPNWELLMPRVDVSKMLNAENPKP